MDTSEPRPSLAHRLLYREPPRWLLLVLVCVVLAARGRAVEYLSAGRAADDPDGYGTVADELVRNGQFARGSFHWMPVVTAARPPLYPLVLAAISYAGTGLTSMAVGMLHVVLSVATVVLTWHLGRFWSLPPGGRLIAAALVAIDPILLAYSAQLMTETLAACLAALALVAVTRSAQGPSLPWALAAGATLGLCILCRPEFLVWAVGVAALFPLLAVGERRLLRTGVCVLSIAAVLAPWAVRNARVFGRPVITTTHGGATLLLANNPSFFEYLRSAPWGTTWNGAVINDEYVESQRLHSSLVQGHNTTRLVMGFSIDEVAVDREMYRRAFENIRAEPGTFLYACLVRMGRLWAVMPHQLTPHESPSRRGTRYATAIWYAGEFALAIIGAWFLGRKLLGHPWVWGLLLLGSFTAVHAFYWTDMRMRAPLSSVIALAAAAGMARLLAKEGDAKPLPNAA